MHCELALKPSGTTDTHTMFTLTSLKLCLTVSRVLVQALLLIDDDVLDVLHRQVVPEGMKKDVFQLFQCYPLHVKLQRQITQKQLLNQTQAHQKLQKENFVLYVLLHFCKRDSSLQNFYVTF